MGALPWTLAAPKFPPLCFGKQSYPKTLQIQIIKNKLLMSPRLTPVKHFEGEKHCVIPKYFIIYKTT